MQAAPDSATDRNAAAACPRNARNAARANTPPRQAVASASACFRSNQAVPAR